MTSASIGSCEMFSIIGVDLDLLHILRFAYTPRVLEYACIIKLFCSIIYHVLSLGWIGKGERTTE